MDDEEILARIQGLVDEEHQLRKPGGVPDPERSARLGRLEEALDQCWDLLRQRRALREFGEDESKAHVRDVESIESSLQ